MRDTGYIKNYKMANKGMLFEEEIIKANEGYKNRGIALIQKISTPWQVKRQGKKIVSAFPVGKSTLDFRGTVKPGISISFDCKEVEKEDRGLPLKNIESHQIEYIKEALYMGEVSFILCYMKMFDKRYLIQGNKVIDYWVRWKANKGKRGFNYIPVEIMTEVKSRSGIVLDYLEGLEGVM
ncbi:Holliday junction resolvase RecU [Tepidibacter hydrothermalis]|uniref:Holliday junction resolvase RecU n=1 Tax=Tepidibacter hydrothermalis TaxID=3036126 RepID=A0ABY8EA16_9FIRM|nr:Holliday junction resolvase RecU [Tepidibacter hydrothermalis]WFD09757.1 Holliday junction resolvase RecU [Tepidibacter hydrothermalis]